MRHVVCVPVMGSWVASLLLMRTSDEAVFTLMTRGLFLDVGVKIYIETNGGIFDVNTENDCASPKVKSPSDTDPI